MKPEAPPRPRKRPRGVPDPAVHRLIAELSEVRMRAKYWHVQGDGFAVLKSGLRTAYTASRNGLTRDMEVARWGGALRTLDLGLTLQERAWTDLIGAEIAVLRDARKKLDKASRLIRLSEGLSDQGPPAEQAKTLVCGDAEGLRQEAVKVLKPLLSETPARFIDRHAGYWSAWRGD